MFGPCRSDWRTTSAGHSVEGCQLLQRDPDTPIPREGRAQVSEGAAAERGKSSEGAARGWAPSRIPTAGGVSSRTNRWKAQDARAANPFALPNNVSVESVNV